MDNYKFFIFYLIHLNYFSVHENILSSKHVTQQQCETFFRIDVGGNTAILRGPDTDRHQTKQRR